MFYKKRAQAEIITTVLIILLVLAAIVIVWQVVKSTVESGGEQVTLQSSCMGVSLELSCSDCPATNTSFIVKRDASGGTFTTATVAVIKDGSRVTTGFAPTYNEFGKPLGTATIVFTPKPTTSVEVALIGDEVTCPATAKITGANKWV